MAAIDKTYLCEHDYVKVIDWCKNIGDVTIGEITFNPYNFICFPDKKDRDEIRESSGENGVVLWNTPQWFDVWLIKNCPFECIQDRLLEQYGKNYISDVIEGKSAYDTYQRNGLGNNLHVRVIKKATMKYHGDFCYRFRKQTKQRTCIYINDLNNKYDLWEYDGILDKWFIPHKEFGRITSNCYVYYTKEQPSLQQLLRLFRKWNLPAGLQIKVIGEYKEQNWLFNTTAARKRHKK